MTALTLMRAHPLPVVWATAALGVRIVFWAVTDRTWEDALITISNARNAVEGLGLTNHPGEGLVHAYTSALSVLIPLVGELLRPGWGLGALRVASLVAVVVAIGFAYAISRRLGLSGWTTSLALAYLALNHNHIFYGMAGMETQVAVAVVLAGVFYILAGQYVGAGLAAGLAILARPDLVLLSVPVLVWAATRGWRALLQAGSVALGVVVPWVAFTVVYYGSPIPQSIPAKALVWSPLRDLDGLTSASLSIVGGQVAGGIANTVRGFTPFFEDTFVVSAPLPLGLLLAIGATMTILTIIGAWETRRIPGWWPALVFVSAFAAYRMLLLPPSYFDWYVPPFTAVCALLVAAGLQRMSVRTPALAKGLTVALVASVAAPFPFTTALEARIQQEVENGVRQPVGLYLGDVMSPSEEFMAESAGYFGYYSRRTIWDQPGITSPTSYAVTRTLPPEDRRVEGLVNALRPDWAVLRPMEWARLERDFPGAARCYVATRSFGVSGRDRIGWGALEKVTLDWSYTVYRREGCPQIGR